MLIENARIGEKRCEHTNCVKRPVEGGTMCEMHGGVSQQQSMELKRIRNYQLNKFQAEVERHANSSYIKDLRDEAGIMRMMLEKKINAIKDETDLMLQTQSITEMISRIERLVVSMHALDSKTNQVLDKTILIDIATRMVNAIADELQDSPEKLDKISISMTQIIKTI